MIGQTIKHYPILELLGQGGIGIVYEAEFNGFSIARLNALCVVVPDLLVGTSL